MRRWMIGLGALVLAAGIAVAAGAGGGFDSKAWKAESGSNAVDNPRAGMVADLEKLLRPGMARAEVEALLGQPEGKRGDGAYVYDLGVARYGVDYQWFVVEFDDAGVLIRFSMSQG